MPEVANNVLVVAGMHRSGTSLVSQWLHGCGLQLGDELLGAAGGNIEGHFEDTAFLRLHQDLLREQGIDFAGLAALPEQLETTPLARARMASVIALKNAAYPQWGWKEPRTCLFLDTYAELLPQAKYLMVLRDSEAVVGSLIARQFGYTEQRHLARGWLGRQVWLRLLRAARLRRHCHQYAEAYLAAWVHYNARILRALDALPESRYLVISHSTLHEQGQDVYNFLSERWHFWLHYKDFSSVYKKELITRKVDIAAYIDNADLLQQARGVGERLGLHLQRSEQRLAGLA